ncbi:MAG: methyltransferase domain-containing protein [Candidatus Latescibacterota bacterium]|nr:MAG: methyltransferase domain-containing protein [Candidatus Latescibacterota bacterium]
MSRPVGAVHFQPQDVVERAYLLPPRSRPLLLVGRSATEVEPLIRALESAGRQVVRHHPGESWIAHLPAETGTPTRDHVWEPALVVRRALAHRGRLRGSTALDLACGSGRNAVFLAMAGMQVTAIDVLPDALERVSDLAQRHRVRIRTLRGDLSQPAALHDQRADLIVVARFLERGLFAQIEDALLPGGILAYETFVQGQPRQHPRNPRFLLQAGELRTAFPRLVTLEYESDNSTDAHVDRLIARRPTS